MGAVGGVASIVTADDCDLRPASPEAPIGRTVIAAPRPLPDNVGV